MGPRIREDNGRGGLGCAQYEMGKRVFVSGVFVIFCGGNEGWVGVGSGDFLLGYGSRGGGLATRKCWHSGEGDGFPHSPSRGQAIWEGDEG